MWSKIFHITLWLTLVTFIPVATGINKLIMEEVVSAQQLNDLLDIPLEDQLEPSVWTFDFLIYLVSYTPIYTQGTGLISVLPLLSTPPPECSC